MDLVYLEVKAPVRPDQFNPLFVGAPESVEHWLKAHPQSDYTHTYTILVAAKQEFVPAAQYLQESEI